MAGGLEVVFYHRLVRSSVVSRTVEALRTMYAHISTNLVPVWCLRSGMERVSVSMPYNKNRQCAPSGPDAKTAARFQRRCGRRY
ncbi:Uncharacterised protein [Halioglobus japonicus]|nr:Uncharacterised protein [Halioglobus japonicus]